jgi:hypothetical protein
MKAAQHSRLPPAATRIARSTRANAPDSTSTRLLDNVGIRLRAAYADTMTEPLPVRLTDLLERLGQRERSRDPGEE